MVCVGPPDCSIFQGFQEYIEYIFSDFEGFLIFWSQFIGPNISLSNFNGRWYNYISTFEGSDKKTKSNKKKTSVSLKNYFLLIKIVS